MEIVDALLGANPDASDPSQPQTTTHSGYNNQTKTTAIAVGHALLQEFCI
jgi:hypothetical protein